MSCNSVIAPSCRRNVERKLKEAGGVIAELLPIEVADQAHDGMVGLKGTDDVRGARRRTCAVRIMDVDSSAIPASASRALTTQPVDPGVGMEP